MTSFLSSFASRSVKFGELPSVERADLFFGQGAAPQLEVVVARAPTRPTFEQVRSAWKRFRGNRPPPVLLVVLHGAQCTLCGPVGDDPPPYSDLDVGQVQRICAEALEAPDRHFAERALRASLPAVTDARPGVINQGFLATHELDRGVPQRADWKDAHARALPLLQRKDDELLRGLGFEITPHTGGTSILRASGKRVALAVLLRRDEAPEANAARFNDLSPVTYALKVADDEHLDYLVVVHGAGRQVRVYPTKISAGVGRRSRSETFVECHGAHLRDADAAYLWLLCSATALSPGGSLEQILGESRRYAGELAKDLRDRIYEHVVPELAEGLVAARALRRPTAADLAQTYEMAMTVLFRLLFIAYAEDKDLLPYETNGEYQSRSLKRKATEVRDRVAKGVDSGDGDALWSELRALFDAVNVGNPAWGVPGYDGGLFSTDPDVSPVGALLTEVSLPDRVTARVLQWLLLVDDEHDGLGPVDFRSLGVREFGTVYEGLLESELSVAETNLAVDKKDGNWRPCKPKEEPTARKGQVYLHNRSGARKASGSYFTKEFAVENLLEKALEPALKEHLARVGALDDTDAAKAFFDFRVADIAMGSGHFLVAAVDRIEKRFVDFLAQRRLPAVFAELEKLRESAKRELGALGASTDIEDARLLRRLIARRCIYGVDLNPVSVNLARLAIWIHTFVPGLPLSLLDHNLVHGNSLVGIGRLSEIKDMLAASGAERTFFDVDPMTMLGAAAEPLRRLANVSDATFTELKAARKAHADAKRAVAPAEAVCDVATAARIAKKPLPVSLDDWERVKKELVGSLEHATAKNELRHLSPLHFPVAFPEVFLRELDGFDVVLGNPPWEKARVEEHEFWARHLPGLRGKAKPERDRTIESLRVERVDLVAAWENERAATESLRDAIRDMPGMNTGHPDLFRAFIWRFVQLIRPRIGHIGVVLPGDTFKIAGASELRERLASACSSIDVQMLTNTGEWVFADVDGRKLISLVAASAKAGHDDATYHIPPEVHGMEVWERPEPRTPAVIPLDVMRRYDDTLVVPVLPTDDSFSIVEAMLRSPRTVEHSSLAIRRVYADFETTKDNAHWQDERLAGDWPVYKGESFDIWQPDTSIYYAYTNGERIAAAAQTRRSRANRSSPYSLTPSEWRSDPRTHPVLRPRIAFRNVTNRTNSRTLLTALIPGQVVNVELAPWVLWLDPQHPTWHEAFLLGAMSSRPADWWCRRFVEGHVDQQAFNSLRVPRTEPKLLTSRVVALAGRLACPDERFAEWAESVGVECGPLAADDKDDKIRELDAVVAHLYGLSETQLVHIFETFHEGWDYEEPLRATLVHFRDWKRRMG